MNVVFFFFAYTEYARCIAPYNFIFLFEPFVQENVEIDCAFKLFNNDLPPVRLFKGDGDQDRPSILNK